MQMTPVPAYLLLFVFVCNNEGYLTRNSSFAAYRCESLTGADRTSLLYYLNLTPLDRNLEWDRKTNLNPEKRRMGYEYQNNCRP